ncbi:hypothetical protein, partial [Streptomyces sp. NPDC059378]|uniref:hypothetical protein n=1 Tax=Streptomyces sp. NPDC059378 TaxID=3346815 RepID=UPI0036CF7E9A
MLTRVEARADLHHVRPGLDGPGDDHAERDLPVVGAVRGADAQAAGIEAVLAVHRRAQGHHQVTEKLCGDALGSWPGSGPVAGRPGCRP